MKEVGERRKQDGEKGGRREGESERETHLVVLPDVPDQQHERLVDVDSLLS